MQEYTQSGGVRPFGVSLLICGWDDGRGYLFQADASGSFYAWKATAMGKNYINGKTFLEKKFVSKIFSSSFPTAVPSIPRQFLRMSRVPGTAKPSN